MYLVYQIGGWLLQRNLWQYVEEGILHIHSCGMIPIRQSLGDTGGRATIPPGTLTVPHDGTLTVAQPLTGDTAAGVAAVAGLCEGGRRPETQAWLRLTAA